MKRLLLAAALSLITSCTILPGAAVAAASPAWSIVAIPFPTSFEAGSADETVLENGPGYQIQAFNAGGAATSGEFTISDTLPGPIDPVASFPAFGFYGPAGVHLQTIGVQRELKLSCSTAGHTITCTGGGEGKSVGPGEEVALNVPVEVEAGARGTVLDKARIFGGGARAAASTTVPTHHSAPNPFGFVAAGVSPVSPPMVTARRRPPPARIPIRIRSQRSACR